MRTLEARDLERQIGEILMQIRETKETIAVTQDGEIIARLVPTQTQSAKKGMSQDAQALNAELDTLAEEVGNYWPEDVSAVEAIRDVRD